jgi:hypothetical protein
MERLEGGRVDVKVIRPPNVQLEKMSAVHIGGEIIRQATGAKIPMAGNLRDAQVEEILARSAQARR